MDKNFIIDDYDDLTPEKLRDLIAQHRALCVRYEELNNYYIGLHPIWQQIPKMDFKPDNRLVVNFAKYIVDTFNGYFIGSPVGVNVNKEATKEYLEDLSQYNNLDDNNYDLSKKCSIYGHAYELIFVDEEANVGIVQVDPRECFIIYDTSIREKKLFGVRYRINKTQGIEGSISDNEKITYFKENKKGELVFTEEEYHYFGEVPIVEYVENEEKLGAFEPVETLINAYNKAISEKANDVDYFADAYMKILGEMLEEDDLKSIRDNRIINLEGTFDKLVVEFMEKPNADQAQENLIDRLQKLIFSIAMVADISDEHFATTSGIALKYKLQAMSNLASTKERKFTKAFNERFRIVSNLPNNPLSPDDVLGLTYTFKRNTPNNLLEEAEIARSLTGIISYETILENISIISNSKKELDRIKSEGELLPYMVGRDEHTL